VKTPFFRVCLLVVALAIAALYGHVKGAEAPAGRAEPPAPPPPPVETPKVSAQEVLASIERGVAYLKSQQAEDGSWPYEKLEHRKGLTALVVFALSECAVPENDPAIAKGMEVVLSQPLRMNYDAACAAMAEVSVNAGKYVRDVAAARDLLSNSQNDNGMWTYAAADVNKSAGDNSNTQFAVLGLHAAMSVGLSVPEVVLKRAEAHYSTTQNPDGGWGYQPGGPSYGSMTAAGVGALYILGARLYVESEVCGQYRQDPRIAAGFAWLGRNFSVTYNPRNRESWVYYYLYALERVGVFTGERYVGGHDWYMEGSRFAIDSQNTDGSWTGGRDVLANTCFALLFLAKGNVPLLVNKLSAPGVANVDVHDADNLARFVSARLGQRVSWQTVTMDDSLETLLAAPVLYVTGHEFPKFSAADVAKLRAFFENGGFILADACCGSKDFDKGLRAFAAAAFPDVPLVPLDRSHPVYRSLFNLSAGRYNLEGVEAGCRLALAYSPVDLSCAWEKNDVKAQDEALRLGANIAAYITGKEPLAPRLEQYRVISPRKVTAPAPGAFTLAQVVYGTGRWNPHPAAGPKLIDFLNAKAGLTVSSQQVNITLTDKNLPNYPFIYLTGCQRFTLSAEEKKSLKDYLEHGGFLFSDAACGKVEFDESFKALMRELFPSAPLEPIPPDSPVYHIAFDTTRVNYTAAVRELNPNLTTFTLYGVKIGGRVAVVYSPYDIGCALEQFPAYGSRGLMSDDAFKAAANIVLYALSY